jgi:prephenate dehydratase
MKAAYLGPPGTFSEEALLTALPDVEPIPYTTERAAILAVDGGGADVAVVPIENSIEGGVTGTLDTLAHDAPGVSIAGEIVVAVTHRLLVRAGTKLEDVRAVVSHPQALAQCARFLDAELPRAERIAATSTAEAVRDVGASGEPRAAIGTALAGQLYGCEIAREGIEDEPGNQTRFVVVRRTADVVAAQGAGPFKTTVLFAGAGDAAPGWLVRCLSEFAFRGINLTKIESRPRKRRLGHYLFLLDCDGRADAEPVAGALDGLRGHCEEVRVLGSYSSSGA